MHYTKKICAIGLAIILGPLAFGQVEFPDHAGSVQAHKQLTAKVFEMLRTKQYTAAKKFLDSIPPCSKYTKIKKNQLPAYCAEEEGSYEGGVDTRWFPVEAKVESVKDPGFTNERYPLNTVSRGVIVYDALRTHYRYLFGNNPYDPGKFDKNKSVRFYNIYKKTWLGPKVKSLLFVWPHALNVKNKPWEYGEGAEAYDKITLARALGLPLDTEFYAYRKRNFKKAKLILDGAWSRAVETGDKDPFYFIKRKMSEFILDPAGYNNDYSDIKYSDGEFNFYPLVRLVSVLGAEDDKQAQKAWEVILIKPFSKKMKDNAQKLSDYCFKYQGHGYDRDPYKYNKYNKKVEPVWCINFKKRAQKYGLIAPDIKTVKQEIRDRVNTPGMPFIFPK